MARARRAHHPERDPPWAANCGYPVHVHRDEAGFIGEPASGKFPHDMPLRQALDRIRPRALAFLIPPLTSSE